MAAMLLAGCQLTSPIQTAQPYEPADGVSVDLGTVVIRDLLVVASAKGTAGVLSGLIVNKGDAPVTVSIGAADGTPVTAQVGPRSATRLSGGTGTPAAPLANVASDPGGMVELNVNTPAGGTDQVTVPVLPPTGYYSTLTAAPTAPAG
ncbi:MAG TPA: hypothetical protein VFJ97_13010 [Dermatophilaceae bacterium]|nr:hypothetical protein [Dermatophilaceae bacterium]